MWLIYDKITFTSRITSGPCFLQFRTILVSISYKLYIVTPHGHVPVLILFIFDIADISQNNLFSLLPYLFLSNLTWCFFPSSRLPGAAGLSSLHLCAFSVSVSVSVHHVLLTHESGSAVLPLSGALVFYKQLHTWYLSTDIRYLYHI